MTAHDGRLPDVLLAGVPKAGTSTLARWLGAHPEVHLPPQKEVHFFDEHADAGLDWYRSQFAGPGRLAVDATPTYALRDEWLAAAVQAMPSARVVLLLRHPVERLWSAYWYLRSMGLERRSLEQVALDGMAAPPAQATRVAAGDYETLLDRVDRYVAPDRVLVLLQDDLAAAPDDVWDRTCAFVGIDGPRPDGVGERLNVTGTLRSFHLRHWTLRLHLFRRAPRIAHALDRWNRTERRPPPVPPHLRRRLLEHYEPAVAAVEQRLGRELPGWRR